MSDRHLDRHARIVAAYHVGPMQSHETIKAALEGNLAPPRGPSWGGGNKRTAATKATGAAESGVATGAGQTTRRGKSW